MILTKFDMYYIGFEESQDIMPLNFNKKKVYSVGLMLEASKIDEKIQTIFSNFTNIYVKLFLVPYIFLVLTIVLFEIL